MKVYGPYTYAGGRQLVVLIDETGRRRTQSYPRFLMEQKLGRILLPTEEVDHKDNNPANNDINNLQLLTKRENILKSVKPRKMYRGTCVVCASDFVRPLNTVKGNRKQGKKGPFCSRRCAGKGA